MSSPAGKPYEVALSFAGEQRDYVRAVAKELDRLKVPTFFDENEEVELWGKDLPSYLAGVYRHKARFVVPFISKEYMEKGYPQVELRAAVARWLKEMQEYILPVMWEGFTRPDLFETIGTISTQGRKPEDVATLIAKKVALPTAGSAPPSTSPPAPAWDAIEQAIVSRVPARVEPAYADAMAAVGRGASLPESLWRIAFETTMDIGRTDEDRARATRLIAATKDASNFKELVGKLIFPWADEVGPATANAMFDYLQQAPPETWKYALGMACVNEDRLTKMGRNAAYMFMRALLHRMERLTLEPSDYDAMRVISQALEKHSDRVVAEEAGKVVSRTRPR